MCWAQASHNQYHLPALYPTGDHQEESPIKTMAHPGLSHYPTDRRDVLNTRSVLGDRGCWTDHQLCPNSTSKHTDTHTSNSKWHTVIDWPKHDQGIHSSNRVWSCDAKPLPNKSQKSGHHFRRPCAKSCKRNQQTHEKMPARVVQPEWSRFLNWSEMESQNWILIPQISPPQGSLLMWSPQHPKPKVEKQGRRTRICQQLKYETILLRN